jgi:hypothetical protein
MKNRKSQIEPPKFRQRIACLWIPNWPIQRLVVARPELRRQYLVLFQQDPRRGRLIAAASPLATQAGVRVGMPLSEAKSLLQRATASNGSTAANNRCTDMGDHPAAANNHSCWVQAPRFGTNNHHPTTSGKPQTAPVTSPQNSDLFFILEHDPAADYLALTELADSLSQFSPIVGLEQIDSPAGKHSASSILLEITGLERLFGSEEQLATRLLQFVQTLQYVPRLAIANTLGVAWGASRFGTSRSLSTKGLAPGSAAHPFVNQPAASKVTEAEITSAESQVHAFQIDPDYCLIIPADDSKTFLQLPIESLRLEPQTVSLLHQLGIKTNEQLWQLPRAELAMRFGDAIHRRIDQASGRQNEPLVARQTPTEFTATQLLEYPTNHRETIEVIVGRLLEQVSQQLRARQQGGLQWLITLLLVDEPPIRLNLNLFQASATASEIMPLVEMQLEQQLLPKHPGKYLPSRWVVETSDVQHRRQVQDERVQNKRIQNKQASSKQAFNKQAQDNRVPDNRAHDNTAQSKGALNKQTENEQTPSEPVHHTQPFARCRVQIQEIQVAVTSAVLLVPQQRLLFDEGPQLNRQALTQLINRLTSRLGQPQVVYPQLLSGAQPEYSYRFRPLVDIHRHRRIAGMLADQSHVVGRPLRTFNPAIEIELKMKNSRDRYFSILCDTMTPSLPTPLTQGSERSLGIGLDYGSRQPSSGQYQGSVPFSKSELNSQSAPNHGAGGEGNTLDKVLISSPNNVLLKYRDTTYSIIHATGPERIETGWWRGPTVCRDYWRVETDTGQSLWIYRDLRNKNWFLQGEF